MSSLKNKYFQKYIFILLITFLSCIYIYFFLYFERRILGISNTYHPDSLYYYNNFLSISRLSFKKSLYENFSGFYNSFFSNTFYPSLINLIYEFNKFINSSQDLSYFHSTFYRNIIYFNIFIHLFLNFLVINIYLKKFQIYSYDFKNIFFLIIILFLPYRCHLTVNILKDSLILFSLIIFLTRQNIYFLILSFAMATSFRFGAIIYYIGYFNYKNLNKKIFVPLLILIIIVLFFLFFKLIYKDYNFTLQNLTISVKEFLISKNVANLGGRTFDEVPNFFQYELGSLIRAITWPFLFLSGGFAFFTKSYLFYILSIEILFVQIIFYYLYKKSIITINLILILFIIGIYTNTFTAYFRYSYLAFYMSLLISFFNIKHKI